MGFDGEGQGNVQPVFVGVFDTVAALGSRTATIAASIGFAALVAISWWLWCSVPWFVAALFTLLPITAAYWVIVTIKGQVKYFFDDPNYKPKFWNPFDWKALVKHGHFAWWSGKNYDRYIDKEVRFLRHAISIDEARTKFPRVGWGRSEDVLWNSEQGNKDWLRQVWFSGNHSDIGGSYPEEESRLSDISLQWMVDELVTAMPDLKLRRELLYTFPDPCGLQHDERVAVLEKQPAFLRKLSGDRLTWTKTVRNIRGNVDLHTTVIERFALDTVPQMGEVKPYRPPNLREHAEVAHFYQMEPNTEPSS